MFLPQILEYLLWPAFMVVCWFAVKTALLKYEEKFPGKDDE
jgi:hypothetical protein